MSRAERFLMNLFLQITAASVLLILQRGIGAAMYNIYIGIYFDRCDDMLEIRKMGMMEARIL